MNEEKGRGLLYVLLGCAGVCLVGLCLATGFGVYLFARDGGDLDVPEATPAFPEPPSKPPAAPPAPGVAGGSRLRVAATVHSRTGSFEPAGARCLFEVEVPSVGSSGCRAQIVCGGRLVYGGQNAGYFPCEPSPGGFAGRDDQTTAVDGDAAMAIDTQSGVLSVRDDASGASGAFALEARIDSVE